MILGWLLNVLCLASPLSLEEALKVGVPQHAAVIDARAVVRTAEGEAEQAGLWFQGNPHLESQYRFGRRAGRGGAK